MFDHACPRRDTLAGSRSWHGEPRVEDLLEDPVMQLVMRRDQVCRDELARLIEGVRETLRRG
jgi:hypothetical protein